MSITAEYIVELFERDARARKRLAALLVSDPEVRLSIINAVLRDVATKQDLEKLREEFHLELERLEERVRRLEERMARVEGQINLLVKLFIAFNVPVLVGIIGILLKLALTR